MSKHETESSSLTKGLRMRLDVGEAGAMSSARPHRVKVRSLVFI